MIIDALLATLINQLRREVHFAVDLFMGQRIIDNVNQERRTLKEEKSMSFISEMLRWLVNIFVGWA